MYVSEADYRGALSLVADAAATAATAEFAHIVTHRLGSLLRSNESSYGEVAIGPGRWTFFAGYPTRPRDVPEAARLLRAHGDEHPLVPWMRRQGRLVRHNAAYRAVRLSDLCPGAELGRHPYFVEFYRARGIRFADYAVLAGSRDRAVGIGVGRARRDYSEREHDLLRLLAPPLGCAWRTVLRAERLRRAVDDATATDGRQAWAGLTDAEQRVATLVAGGLENAAVAARLDVSVKAVEQHLTRVYAKVGVRSRAQLVVSAQAQPATAPAS